MLLRCPLTEDLRSLWLEQLTEGTDAVRAMMGFEGSDGGMASRLVYIEEVWRQREDRDERSETRW